MNWISIDQEKCTSCGICVTRCAVCFKDRDGEITVRADADRCNLCGHCVALCPTDAVIHHKLDMDNFLPINREADIDPDHFAAMVRARRSQRIFKDKPVSQSDLENLVDLARYAPTGSNKQNTGIIVIQDKERIKKLSDMTVDYFEENVEKMEQKIKDTRNRGEELPEDLQPSYSMTDSFRRLIVARKYGFEVIFHEAPAVLIFHAPTNTSSPKDDCVIASTTLVLAAMTMGLGTCYIGLFEFAARAAYQPIIDDLGLAPPRKVMSVLVVGHPKLKYLRNVDRKQMDVRWE